MIKYENILKKTRPYQTILSDKVGGQLNHCYMIIAEDTTACDGLCQLACRTILCKNNDCEKCNDCLRVEKDSHTDVISLHDFSAKGVREFVANSYMVANEGSQKVMLIKQFEQITPSVQNFLLKIFEEPSEQVVFVIGVSQPSMVLDTIKSRSKKVFLDELDIQLIKEELLWQGLDDEKVKRAVDCSFGNLTNAINFACDEQFVDDFDLVINILTNMQTSRQMADSLVKMNLKSEEFVKYLDCFEIICKVLMDFNCGVNKQGFEQLKQLSKVFNIAMIVNISDLVVNSRKKIQSNCKVEAVASSLLLGILEVKFKCR